IKDSSQLVIQNLDFQLRLGMMRLLVPKQTGCEEKSFRISAGQLMTSVMQGSSRRDVALRIQQDTTLIAVYEGDSLSVTRRNRGEKAMEYMNIPQFRGMAWVVDQVKESFELAGSVLNPVVWGRDLEHVAYLMENQDIDQAKIDLESIVSLAEEQAQMVTANLQLSYLALYDNQEEQALDYMNRILQIEPVFQLPGDYTSPKILNIYHRAVKSRDEMRLAHPEPTWLRRIYPLIPGLPQLRSGKHLKGYGLLTADLLLWSGFFYHHQRQDHFQKLADQSLTPSEVDRHYDQSMDHYHTKQLFFYSALGIHLLNALDYYIFDKKQPLSFQFENQTVYCRMAFRF
ncbi:MAG: hypothetical protein KBA26_14005, partial [Candidatus Delongbacteria bacterium]|nr:hypothetical protein [Candidatus Delongbacteria bacterium]